jgi:hypothetical protein
VKGDAIFKFGSARRQFKGVFEAFLRQVPNLWGNSLASLQRLAQKKGRRRPASPVTEAANTSSADVAFWMAAEDIVEIFDQSIFDVNTFLLLRGQSAVTATCTALLPLKTILSASPRTTKICE